MADVLQQNLERLTSPYLARRIKETEVSRVELTSRGLRLAGMSLCSAVDPLREAERWAVGVELSREPHYLVVFGLALGHHIEALRRRTDAPLLVLEPSLEVIRVALEQRPLALERVRIVNTPVELRDHLASILCRRQVVESYPWPPTRRLFAAVHEAAGEAVREAGALATVSNDTLEQRLRVWVRHFLANLPPCVGRVPGQSLAGWLEGYPAVLVAAGPSLDRNVELLAEAGDRAVVVGVNTAMGALERSGVRADFVVALEVLDVACQLSALQLNRDIGRLLCTWANPSLFSLDGGQVYPFAAASPYFARVSREAGLGGGVDMGGSVANAAFNLLRMMSADPIVLVGQDLAYTDSRAYARGTVFEKIEVQLDDHSARLQGLELKQRIGASVPGADTTRAEAEVTLVPGWGGGSVPATLEFNYFRYMFETYARYMPDTRLVNATEGGASINGFEEQPLERVLDQLPPRPCPPRPTRPVLAQTDIEGMLARELEAARSARKLALAARQNPVQAALDRMGAAVKQGGLLEAHCWQTLQAVIADADASPEDLCLSITVDATETAQLINSALDTLRHSAAE